MCAAEIHRELCAIYGQNIKSEGTVRQWRKMFKDELTNVHDEEQSGRPSVVSEDLVQSVDQKFVKDDTSNFRTLL
jgi:transposase